MLLFYVRSTRVPPATEHVYPRTKLPPLVHDSLIDRTVNIVLSKEEAQACAKQCQEQGLPYGWIRGEDPTFKVKSLTTEEAEKYLKLENRLTDGPQGKEAS